MITVVESLRQQILSCEAKLRDLREQLAEAENALREQEKILPPHQPVLEDSQKAPSEEEHGVSQQKRWPLRPDEYKRYGRQLIIPEIGLRGQLHLQNSRVLIAGVGGLGCPAAAYLAGAGIGTLGLMDGDVVEVSNLHRQILHSTPRVGMTKVESAMAALSSLNPNVKLIPHETRLTTENAISIFQDYDLVLDCTDTPASRYLISDTCILLGKPLISASALRIDGQLMVLNHPPLPPGDQRGGPCYRCVFPKPPPPESVVSCGDGGILGPVVGVMGVLQALEAIKVLTQTPGALSSMPTDPPTLLLFSAYSNPMFRSIRLRSRKPKCAACSAEAIITTDALESGSLDYVQFCGVINPVDALTSEERISAKSYAALRPEKVPLPDETLSAKNHILVDVREKVQFELCHIDGSINVPFSIVSTTSGSNISPKAPDTAFRDIDVTDDDWVSQLKRSEEPIFVVCRLGNDSQMTVKKMKDLGLDLGGKRYIGDIIGGLQAWRRNVDTYFPDY